MKKLVHYHQKNKALTACGRPWLSFWDKDPSRDWHRGQLPYGEHSTTDAKVTCQECLEARYKIKSAELEELHSRIDIFWVGKTRTKRAKIEKKMIDENALGKRVAAFVISELRNLE